MYYAYYCTSSNTVYYISFLAYSCDSDFQDGTQAVHNGACEGGVLSYCSKSGELTSLICSIRLFTLARLKREDLDFPTNQTPNVTCSGPKSLTIAQIWPENSAVAASRICLPISRAHRKHPSSVVTRDVCYLSLLRSTGRSYCACIYVAVVAERVGSDFTTAV